MKLFAIETAEQPGSLAVAEAAASGEPSVTATTLPSDRRTAQSLASGIKSLLAEVGWRASDIDLVAVTVGPGSFTGLRIGVTAAKSLAYAAEAKCVAVDTLAVLAAQAGGASGWAVVDAQRSEVFAAPFASGEPTAEPTIVPQDEWLARLTPGETVIGPVLRKLREQLPEGVIVAPESDWQPQAESCRPACPRFKAAAGETCLCLRSRAGLSPLKRCGRKAAEKSLSQSGFSCRDAAALR